MRYDLMIDGEASLILDNAVIPDLVLPEDGEAGNVIKVRDTEYPIYPGETTVTPSEEEITLATKDTTVIENIKINAIPANYGRLAWSGTTLTVY